jgi:hypothetical protein
MLAANKAGCQFLIESGFGGLLHVKAVLLDVRSKSFRWEAPYPVAVCQEADEIVVEEERPLEIVRSDIGPLCISIFKRMTFAAGYREAFKGNDKALIDEGLKFLGESPAFLSI